jgi:TatD DNase family protein
MLIDIHSHKAPLQTGTLTIVNHAHTRAGVAHEPFSAGLHPWFLDKSTLQDAKNWLQTQLTIPGCVAVGEAGLDKICDTDWQLQLEAFAFCVEIANTSSKPLVIHCVRAFEEVLSFKNKATVPWIFHGFNKKQTVADRLLKAGAYLSFGAALLLPESPAAAALRTCPEDQFFLETDDQEVYSIADIYRAAALMRGVSVPEIEVILEKNYKKYFLSN